MKNMLKIIMKNMLKIIIYNKSYSFYYLMYFYKIND